MSAQPVALLPFARAARGPLRFAVFLGGKDSNFNLGLFRPGGAWSREDVAALLSAAARPGDAARSTRSCSSISRRNWRGVANPLAERPSQPSPSFAYTSALPGDFSAWLDAHASKDAKKKMRKKPRGSKRSAPLVHRPRRRTRTRSTALLAAFHAQRRARTRGARRRRPLRLGRRA